MKSKKRIDDLIRFFDTQERVIHAHLRHAKENHRQHSERARQIKEEYDTLQRRHKQSARISAQHASSSNLADILYEERRHNQYQQQARKLKGILDQRRAAVKEADRVQDMARNLLARVQRRHYKFIHLRRRRLNRSRAMAEENLEEETDELAALMHRWRGQ